MSAPTAKQRAHIEERQKAMAKAKADKVRRLDREQEGVIDSLVKTAQVIGDVAELVKDATAAVDEATKTSPVARVNPKARPTAATIEAEALRQDRQDARDQGYTGDLLKEQTARNTALRQQAAQGDPAKTASKAIKDRFRSMGRGLKGVTIRDDAKPVPFNRPADITIEWGPGRDDTETARPLVEANANARAAAAVEHMKEIETERQRKDQILADMETEARASHRGRPGWLQRHRQRATADKARIPEDRRRRETRPG